MFYFGDGIYLDTLKNIKRCEEQYKPPFSEVPQDYKYGKFCYRRANMFYAQKDYAQAEADYRRTLAFMPEGYGVISDYILGIAHFRVKNYDEAAKYFIAVLVREIIDSCRILKIGDYRAAKEILTKAINLMEKSGCEVGYCYYYLAEICCNLEEYAQAEKIFEKSLELMSTSDFEFEIGMMYFRLKKYKQAAEAFGCAIIEAWGSAPEGRIENLCEIADNNFGYIIGCGEASKTCQFVNDLRVGDHCSGSLKISDNLIIEGKSIEKYSTAELIDYLTKLIEKNPDAAENSELYNFRGQIYSCRKSIGGYIDPIDFIEEYFAEYPEEHFYYKLAIADFKKALELNPACLRAYMNLAWLYRQSGNFELALENYAEALKLCPHNSVAYFYTAKCLDDKQAIEYYLKAYECRNWDYYLSHVWLVRAKIASEAEFKASLKKRNKFIKKNPEHFKGYYKRGKMYYDFEKYELAAADFTRVIELKPNHGLAYFYRGECHKKLDNFIAAGKDFAKAEELGCKEQEVNF